MRNWTLDQLGVLKVQVKRLAAVIVKRRNGKLLDTHGRRRFAVPPNKVLVTERFWMVRGAV